MLLDVKNIHKRYGKTDVLDGVSFSLAEGQKVGLVGDNGTGKSTLLKITAGLVEPDSGSVMVRPGTTVGYMQQDTSLASDETVHGYLKRVAKLAPEEEYRIDKTLAGLKLRRLVADNVRINTLSSGQKNKVFMTGTLLLEPDVLLLDEPTNNLDLESLAWLEDFLAHSRCACVIVSHDRFFLDRLVRRVIEIDARTRTLSVVNGRYSDYLEQARLERERQLADYEAQQDEIKRLVQSARDKRAKAERGAKNNGTDNDKYLAGFKRERSQKSAQTARTIESCIEKMDLVEKPFEKEAFRIKIQPTKAYGNRSIELHNVVAGYKEGAFRIGPISLHVQFGDRIAIIGPNGSGKSTLLKTMCGKLPPLAGEVSVGGGLTIGDFMQEHENLPREEPIKKCLVENGPMTEQEAYAFGAKYGFKDIMDGRIESLSPGGRARLLFALFTARNTNVLVLDEPTNHLDLEALSALEEAVEGYPGTVILVSHDRYFLKKFRSTGVYRLDEGKLISEKSVEDYLARIEHAIEA